MRGAAGGLVLRAGLVCLLAGPLAVQVPLAKDPGPFLEPGQFGTGAEPQRKPLVAGPTPHLADGRPDFGGKGAWYPGFAGNIAEPQWKGVHSIRLPGR